MTPPTRRLLATVALLTWVAVRAAPSDAINPRPAPSRETAEAVAIARGIVSDDGVRLWDTAEDDASPIRELRFGAQVYALGWSAGIGHVTNTPDTVIRVPVALADFSTFGWVRDDEVGFHHRNIRRTRSEWWEAGLENLPSPARSMFHVARSLLLPRWGNGRPHTEIARAARLLDLYIRPIAR